MRDIVITLPQAILWEDYEQELAVAADGGEIKYKVTGFPKVEAGARCYVTHRGFVKGWLPITALVSDDFICSTTGKHWLGKFVVRSGVFRHVEPFAWKGSQGFRYAERGTFTDIL